MKYFVIRTHSGTDQQTIVSTGFRENDDARGWADYCRHKDENKEHSFFIVPAKDETAMNKIIDAAAKE